MREMQCSWVSLLHSSTIYLPLLQQRSLAVQADVVVARVFFGDWHRFVPSLSGQNRVFEVIWDLSITICSDFLVGHAIDGGRQRY